MKVRRREFIKTVGVVGVGAFMFNPILEAFAASDGKKKDSKDIGVWYPSTCQGCTTWCPIEVLVQDGRAVKIRGNTNSWINPGKTCPRGHMIPQETYDPDRIKTPLKRTNPLKGQGVDPQFIPITWAQAMTEIATEMLSLRNNSEAHKMTLLRGRYAFSTDILYTALTRIHGTPNKFSHSTMCAEAEKAGPYFTENHWGYRDYDLDNCKYLLLWGVDPFRSNRMVPSIISKYQAIKANAKVTVVDPVFTSSAAKAHNWVPVIPGTDGALASAIAHEILTAGSWHKPFVGDFNGSGVSAFVANTVVTESHFTEVNTSGIVKWWNLELQDKTATWASAITGIPAATITTMAQEMAAAAPNVSVWLGPGPSMSPRGTYTSMAIHALNGLLGSTGNVGGPRRQPSVPSAGIPSTTSFCDTIANTGYAMPKIDVTGSINFHGMTDGGVGKAAITNYLPNVLLSGLPYDIKMIIGYWCNFPFSGQDTSRWIAALSALPYFVHITTNASEMSQFADIILPAAHPTTERYSYLKTSGNLFSEATIQQPLATRIFDVRSDENEISYLLAQELAAQGFTNLLDYYNTFLDPSTGAAPTDEYEFAEFSTKLMTAPCYNTIGGWNAFKQSGVVHYGPLAYQSYWGNFGTPTGKFEFYCEKLKTNLQAHATTHSTTVDAILTGCNYTAQGDLAFVPHYEPPLRHGSLATYPLTFIDAKSRYNREGRSANLPLYYQFKKLDIGDQNWDDVIKINPVDAALYGITDGAAVYVESEAGIITCTAKFFEGVRPGTVAKCYGQGHWAYGRFASQDYATFAVRGGNNNDILVEDYDRITGSTARNGGFVGVKITLV